MSTEREKHQHNWQPPHGLQKATHYFNRKQNRLFFLAAIREAWREQPEDIVELVEIKERSAEEIVTSVDIPLTEFQTHLATGALIKCTVKPIY